MANSAEKISFSAFQKKLLASSLFPAADRDITIHTCSVPPIPRLFPQNLRISFQHLCSPKEKMQSMYHKNLVLKVHLKGTSTGIVDGTTYVFTEGTAMLVFPFQQHWILHTGSPDKPKAMQERMLFNFSLPPDEQKVLLPLKDRVFTLEKSDYPLLLEFAERLRSTSEAEQAVCPYLLNLFLFRCLARVSPREQKMLPDNEPTVVQTIFNYIRNRYKKKKRGSSYVSPIPQLEAFALPTSSERATQKPTQLCTTRHNAHCSWTFSVYMTYPQASTVAMFFDDVRVCEVPSYQEQSAK